MRFLAFQLACLVVILLLLGACDLDERTPGPTPTPAEPANLELGVLEKHKEITYGTPIFETITVYNCGNRERRSDTLSETKAIERNIIWNADVDLGLGLTGGGAEIEAVISSGYELEVSDQLARSKSQELPASPDSSVEYVIKWMPVVWSGILPFRFQSAQGRIEYQYEQIAFGEVVEIRDRTAKDCGGTPTAEPPTAAPTCGPVQVRTKGKAELRIGPGEHHRLAFTLLTGVPLDVIGKSNTGTWLQIYFFEGQTYWIAESQITVTYGSLECLGITSEAN